MKPLSEREAPPLTRAFPSPSMKVLGEILISCGSLFQLILRLTDMSVSFGGFHFYLAGYNSLHLQKHLSLENEYVYEFNKCNKQKASKDQGWNTFSAR